MDYRFYLIGLIVVSILVSVIYFFNFSKNLPKVSFTWKYIFIIFSIILLISAIVYVYQSFVLPKIDKTYTDNKEYDTDQNVNEIDIYMFTVDWCPYCKKAMPIWNNLTTEYGDNYKGYKLNFITINCTNDEDPEITATLNKYNIEGFPTIKILKGTEIINFDAKLEPDSFKQFLDSVV